MLHLGERAQSEPHQPERDSRDRGEDGGGHDRLDQEQLVQGVLRVAERERENDGAPLGRGGRQDPVPQRPVLGARREQRVSGRLRRARARQIGGQHRRRLGQTERPAARVEHGPAGVEALDHLGLGLPSPVLVVSVRAAEVRAAARPGAGLAQRDAIHETARAAELIVDAPDQGRTQKTVRSAVGDEEPQPDEDHRREQEASSERHGPHVLRLTPSASAGSSPLRARCGSAAGRTGRSSCGGS